MKPHNIKTHKVKIKSYAFLATVNVTCGWLIAPPKSVIGFLFYVCMYVRIYECMYVCMYLFVCRYVYVTPCSLLDSEFYLPACLPIFSSPHCPLNILLTHC